MSDHAKFAALAQRLIAKHGRDVTFARVSNVAANADQPWRGTVTADTVLGPFKAVFIPFRGFTFGSEYTDTSLFKEVEHVCMVAGGQGDLETCHKVTDLGKEYKIEWVQKLRPGDQTILYAFGVD